MCNECDRPYPSKDLTIFPMWLAPPFLDGTPRIGQGSTRQSPAGAVQGQCPAHWLNISGEPTDGPQPYLRCARPGRDRSDVAFLTDDRATSMEHEPSSVI
jgi:hypothetical protein